MHKQADNYSIGKPDGRNLMAMRSLIEAVTVFSRQRSQNKFFHEEYG